MILIYRQPSARPSPHSFILESPHGHPGPLPLAYIMFLVPRSPSLPMTIFFFIYPPPSPTPFIKILLFLSHLRTTPPVPLLLLTVYSLVIHAPPPGRFSLFSNFWHVFSSLGNPTTSFCSFACWYWSDGLLWSFLSSRGRKFGTRRRYLSIWHIGDGPMEIWCCRSNFSSSTNVHHLLSLSHQLHSQSGPSTSALESSHFVAFPNSSVIARSRVCRLTLTPSSSYPHRQGRSWKFGLRLRRECQVALFRQEPITDLVNVFDELQELL